MAAIYAKPLTAAHKIHTLKINSFSWRLAPLSRVIKCSPQSSSTNILQKIQLMDTNCLHQGSRKRQSIVLSIRFLTCLKSFTDQEENRISAYFKYMAKTRQGDQHLYSSLMTFAWTVHERACCRSCTTGYSFETTKKHSYPIISYCCDPIFTAYHTCRTRETERDDGLFW